MIFDYPEGATPLDPDESEGIKLKHITNRAELDRWEQDNITAAYVWLGRRRGKKAVPDEAFLIRLHKEMFGKVWSWAGEYRRTDKNIGVDWVMVPIELKRLLDDLKFWIEHNSFTPDEIAVRFHHRLVWIHLFPNGNGRHARLATDTLLQDVLNQKPFTWGSTNLNQSGNTRSQYIQALRAADQHNFEPLLEFVRE